MISKRRSSLRRHKAPWSQTPNRWVFSNRLNCPRLSLCCRWTGNVFHRRGPAAAEHRSPKLIGTSDDAHRCVGWRVLRSEVSWQSSAWYPGAWPVKHWKTRTAILKVTRWRTGNQWSCRRIGVMSSRRRAPVTSRAAAFWTDCRLRISRSDTPYSSALQ